MHGAWVGLRGKGWVYLKSAGFSLDQMVAQHLLWRLARRHQFVFAMMAAHAPYHSSLHLELEQQWSLVRRYIFGKDFGQADFDVNSVLQMPEGEYKEAVLRKITASAIKEYKDTLETYKTETGKDWCISAKHPAADSLIPDSDLLQEYYQLKSVKAARDPRFATIRSEAIDTAMHTTKIHSCVMQRMCIDAPGHKMCTLCQAVLTQKHATMPDWSPSRILAPLKANGYHMYIPELLHKNASSSVAAKGIPDSEPAVPRDFAAIADEREPCRTHCDNDYHSYKSFAQMTQQGEIQRLCAIPINKNSRDDVFMCVISTCRYVARTATELSRHMILCHEEGDIRCWFRTRSNFIIESARL